ncbi:hypothetical protein Tsubulata_012046 [Turnera subulata]|uniref:Uncharacterized protein n=1 Tax=Turnera subulata TaxID=218843 RepID=A0A9Q0GHA6_9ROSI|nr:hypothetical protein Tsubulata_012046 [Turnera subulata]
MLKAFVGVSIILYSVWMLDQWNHRVPVSPPPASSADSGFYPIRDFSIFADVVDKGFGLDLNSLKLPAPWFIYSFMGYTILKTVLIVIEAGLVAFIAIDHRWEKDLPFDPTGELENFRSFVEENVEITKWIGITVVAIQAIALLLAIVLRAMISTRKNDHDGEDDYENVRGRTWEPLLNQSGQTSGSGAHSDIWSTRMREKYGLKNDKSNVR